MIYDFDDIEAYLHGQMSATDKKAFEAALADDPELADDVEAQRAAEGLMRAMRVEALKKKMRVWEQELAEQKAQETPPSSSVKIVPDYRRWIIPAAAALFGVIVMSIVFWRSKPNKPLKNDVTKDTATAPITVPVPEKKNTVAPTNPPGNIHPPVVPTDNKNQRNKNRGNNHYADVYAVLNARPKFMDGDYKGGLSGATEQVKTTNNYTEALQRYNAGQYQQALNLLENPEAGQQEKSVLLRGYTRYHLQQYAQAEQDFRYFRTVDDMKTDALWCEVFCMVKQLPASRKRLDETLREITTAKTKHHYHQDAVNLQKALERHR